MSFLKQPREILSHHANGQGPIQLHALDGPGPGGASHFYEARFSTPIGDVSTKIAFQHGGVAEKGVNGITHEVLLAILIDRLQAFQLGPYPCHENEMALDHLKFAMTHLHRRTQERQRRGVEGKQER